MIQNLKRSEDDSGLQCVGRFDWIVLGSGFAGALMARIGATMGYRVALLEKQRHPRFAIGESSSPLANVLLESLSEEFELDDLKSFSSWTRWRESNPQIPCGLKRGFSFFKHVPNQSWEFSAKNEWLISASPHDGLADTHWFREALDENWTHKAQLAGVTYLDQFNITSIHDLDERYWKICGARNEETQNLEARWLIDATGPRGILSKIFSLNETALPAYPKTAGIFNHFKNVKLWENCHPHFKNHTATPFPVDDAAAHHVFPGGWMWILRFNNGVISSGISLNEEGRRVHRADKLSPEELWSNVLNAYPSLKEMFEDAEPLQPWRRHDPLPYCTKTIAGSSGSKMWTLLPSAASFVDPLLSTGFPLTLLGIERLAKIAKMAKAPKDSSSDWVTEIQKHLLEYQSQTLNESESAAALVGAMLSNLDNFEIFKNLSRFYFVAASYMETMRRLKRPELASGFLLCNDQKYVSNMMGFIESLREPAKSTFNHHNWIEILKSYDVMGMTEMDRGSRYPVLAEDLLNASERIGIDRPELESLLRNLGM